MAMACMVSCHRNYSIEGNVELYGFEGTRMYLVTHENDEFIAVDSCSVRHGRFNMEGRADSAVFAMLCHGFEPVMPLFIERGNINIHIAPSVIDVSGTRLNDMLYDFLDRKNEIDNHFEDLIQRSQHLADILNPSVSYDDSLKLLVNEAEEFIYGFVKKHYNDPLGVCVFMMACYGDQMSEPTPLIRRIIDNAPDKFLTNRKIRSYMTRVGYN